MARQSVGTRVNKAGNCPNCGESQLIPIVYGFPNEFTMQLSQKGVVELGGCIISGDDPSFRCTNCHHDVWRDGRTNEPDEWHRRLTDPDSTGAGALPATATPQPRPS